ncbi:MAG: exodeoxyribonuclease VII small subunit [Candidatus Magasanikbacteria bacterium RIFCSPHIGHO2_02_FULL_50_9b]|uniref:Exodeoxyribonuclease 7 small subunit n=1 Tax=Candidatus Magasanikbacteria bacterium RIFCSPHIGHO2_02_FULL_50_9b TaxID=1798682 RepID=A0A1F6M9L9_9BACT|nr:MAG: exodeoxyribonuclease VII small subunit [Candidatus Magasanikbacteria bacterium RIFCSPHIGHO2_02_FULL_50_9b]
MSAKSEKQDSFAAQFAELETITQWFERGDVSIEEALEKFERGLKLADELQKYLHGVEQRVTEMKKKFNV